MYNRNAYGTIVSIPLDITLRSNLVHSVVAIFQEFTNGEVTLHRSLLPPSFIGNHRDLFQWTISFNTTRRLPNIEAYVSAASHLANGIVRLVLDVERLSNLNNDMAIDFHNRLRAAERVSERLRADLIQIEDANERLIAHNNMLELELRNAIIDADNQQEQFFFWQRQNGRAQNFNPSAIGNNFHFRFGEETRHLRAAIDYEPEEGEERAECLVCLNQRYIRPIFVCGHRFSCLGCSIVFAQEREPICPVCRNSVVREELSMNMTENDMFEFEVRPQIELIRLAEIALVNQMLAAEQAEDRWNDRLAIEHRAMLIAAEQDAIIIGAEQEPPREFNLVLELPLAEAEVFQVPNVGSNLQHDIVRDQVLAGNELGANQAVGLLGRKRRNPLRLRSGRKVKK